MIRKKEDRLEAADHSRSKTRNQRWIDFLRSTSKNCTWYVMMDPKITPSGQTIVKPTALDPVAKYRL